MKQFILRSTIGDRDIASDPNTDSDLVQAALRNEPAAFRTIMRRNNQRLFRIARGIVRDDAVAEDVVQEAYVRAFQHLAGFRADSTLSTWLHRIVMNEALGRLRKISRRREVTLADSGSSAEVLQFPIGANSDNPEKSMAQRQILRMIEEATDELPDNFRLVFIARVIEGMTVEETAELLGIKPQTVRTRLHRARGLLRQQIDKRIGPVLLDAFPFAGHRCERLTNSVISRLNLVEQSREP